MSNLNETINQVQGTFSDIESALNEQGVDTSNLTPIEYAKAIKGIVNETTKEIGILPVTVFCYSNENEYPDKPSGGKWKVDSIGNSEIDAPTGWYTDLGDVYDASVDTSCIWMSTATFKNDGSIFTNWTSPIRISGKNGKDGRRGDQGLPGTIAGLTQYFYTPYYYGATTETSPSKPSAQFYQGGLINISDGWDTNIDEDNTDVKVWWMSTATYNSSMIDSAPAVFSTPVRISTTKADTRIGVTRKYLLSNSSTIPTNRNGFMNWDSDNPPVPTFTQPYLYVYDITSFSVSTPEVGPVYLLATYSNGLKSIVFEYTCGASEEIVKAEEHPWFNTTEGALTENNEYLGLTEETKFLWCRERFIYVDESQNETFYRILSSFTAAEKAAIIYSAGVFNTKVEYTRTDEQRPYVYYPTGLKINSEGNIDENGKEYYYFVLKYGYNDSLYKLSLENGEYPEMEVAYTNGNWEKMESFEAIYSDIGVFKAANVGQFVFDDKYIFSQLGVDKDDKQEHNYTEYLDYSAGINNSEVKRKGVALAIETGQFIPNILLNAITGEAKFGGGTNILNADGSFSLADGNLKWENNTLTVEGHVTAESFEAKSSEILDSISDLGSSITDASTTWANNLSEYQTATGETINQLNLRLDGAVSNYYKEDNPVTTRDELNALFKTESWYNNIGDTWTNVNNYPDDKDGGKSWRWCEWVEGKTTDSPIYGKDDKKYHWHIITDNDASRALAEAGRAITVANAKTTTFINSNPTNPSEGDLWIVPESYTGSDYIKGKTYVYKDGWKPVTDPSIPDVSDLEDIKRAFKSGSSGFDGGLVFGEALGVFDQKNISDTSDDVLMGIVNGNSQYVDDNNHTIVIAAGIPEEGSDLKTRIQNAKTILCSDGGLKLGDKIKYDSKEGKLNVGDKIVLDSNEGCISVNESYDYGDAQLHIGKDKYPVMLAGYSYQSNPDSQWSGKNVVFKINMDNQQGCYGGGIVRINNENYDEPVPRTMSHCLDNKDLPGVPAMTITSNPVSLCNLAGGIYGLRTGTKVYNQSGTINYSCAGLAPQTIFFTDGQTWDFYLPLCDNSEAGDFFELWLEHGTVNIKGSALSNEGPEIFYINAGNNSFGSGKSSHTWTTPGVYKCIFSGDHWWIQWMGN